MLLLLPLLLLTVSVHVVHSEDEAHFVIIAGPVAEGSQQPCKV
jgi:hypothetical protein